MNVPVRSHLDVVLPGNLLLLLLLHFELFGGLFVPRQREEKSKDRLQTSIPEVLSVHVFQPGYLLGLQHAQAQTYVVQLKRERGNNNG